MKKPHLNAIRFKMRKIVDMKRLSWNLTGMKRAQTDTKSIQKITIKKIISSGYSSAIMLLRCACYILYSHCGENMSAFQLNFIHTQCIALIRLRVFSLQWNKDGWFEYSATVEGSMWVRMWWKGNNNRSFQFEPHTYERRTRKLSFFLRLRSAVHSIHSNKLPCYAHSFHSAGTRWCVVFVSLELFVFDLWKRIIIYACRYKQWVNNNSMESYDESINYLLIIFKEKRVNVVK